MRQAKILRLSGEASLSRLLSSCRPRRRPRSRGAAAWQQPRLKVSGIPGEAKVANESATTTEAAEAAANAAAAATAAEANALETGLQTGLQHDDRVIADWRLEIGWCLPNAEAAAAAANAAAAAAAFGQRVICAHQPLDGDCGRLRRLCRRGQFPDGHLHGDRGKGGEAGGRLGDEARRDGARGGGEGTQGGLGGHQGAR